MKLETSVRHDVALRLQALSTHSGYSQRFIDAADYAIELVLNPNLRRKAGEHLLDNVLRDAKRILWRKQRREQERFCPLDAPVAVPEDSGDELTLADTIPAPDLTPDQAAIAREMADALDQQFAADRTATAVLLGMRRGESSTETALSLGISRSYAKEIRQRVRRAGLAMLAS